ncbi:hypothetical protein M5689_019008 [Euphorbia peplus]|nr:hypothetical protein M5689_019008 [Euphorbia peplus]
MERETYPRFTKNQPRFVVPPPKESSQKWEVVKHKKFPAKLTHTQKRRIQRKKLAEKYKALENAKGDDEKTQVDPLVSKLKEIKVGDIVCPINAISLTLPASFQKEENAGESY